MIRPQYFVLELTNRCQMRCATCTSWRSGRPHGDMPIDMVAEAGHQIRRFHSEGVRVALHGFGEPLLRDDLWVCLDTLHAAGLRNLDFATNCEHLTEERCTEIILRAGYLRMVTLSLNCATAESFKRLHLGATDETFERCVDGCRRMIEANRRAGNVLAVRLQTLHCDATRGENENTLRAIFGPEQGAYLTFLKPANGYKGNVPAEDRTRYGFVDATDCRYYGQYAFLIHWDGDITGCCFDDSKTQVCGNICDGMDSDAVQARIAAFHKQPPPFCVQCAAACEAGVA